MIAIVRAQRFCVLRRVLLPLLLLSLLAGCDVGFATPAATSAPTAPPTATPAPSPTLTLSPTLTASPTPTATPVPSPTPTPGPEAHYERFIHIVQNTQTMYVYEHGVRIRTIPVSTGMPDSEEYHTPAWEGDVGRYVGTFFSFGTYADNAWYLFYHYGSMLIHGAPYVLDNGVKVYQDLDALGVRPLSHGCIRLPPDEAQWFTGWNPQGAHVIIEPLTVKL